MSAIKQACEAMTTTLSAVTILQRAEEGSIRAKRLPFSLAHLLESVGRQATEQLCFGQVALCVEADEALPDRLVGDEMRLRQVLSNLVSNAISDSKPGDEVRLVVTGRKEAAPSDIPFAAPSVLMTFTVVDRGTGISPEDQQKDIFSPFHSLKFDDNSAFFPEVGLGLEERRKKFIEEDERPMRGGIGLGLAICRELVQVLGGHISYESALGQGSTFSATVPFGIADVTWPLAMVEKAKLQYGSADEQVTEVQWARRTCRAIVSEAVTYPKSGAQSAVSPDSLNGRGEDRGEIFKCIFIRFPILEEPAPSPSPVRGQVSSLVDPNRDPVLIRDSLSYESSIPASDSKENLSHSLQLEAGQGEGQGQGQGATVSQPMRDVSSFRVLIVDGKCRLSSLMYSHPSHPQMIVDCYRCTHEPQVPGDVAAKEGRAADRLRRGRTGGRGPGAGSAAPLRRDLHGQHHAQDGP